MGKCKCPGLLKSFLSYVSQLSGTKSCFLIVLILNSSFTIRSSGRGSWLPHVSHSLPQVLSPGWWLPDSWYCFTWAQKLTFGRLESLMTMAWLFYWYSRKYFISQKCFISQPARGEKWGGPQVHANACMILANYQETQLWSTEPRIDFKTILVQFSSVAQSCLTLWPHGLQHARLPCPSSTPRACSNSCPSSQWCHPTISSSLGPLSSHLQSFPASGSFPMSQFFASGGQSIGVSAWASVLPMNIQDWFPLGWTGWISKGLSRVFSNTTV